MDEDPTFLEAFKDDPIFMLGALVLGVFAIIAALIALFVRTKGARIGLGVAALLLGFAALGLGALGTLNERNHTDIVAATPGLSLQDRGRLVTYGYAEANYHLIAGAVCAVPGGALGLLAIVLAFTRKPNAT